MTRDEALALVQSRVQNANMVKHLLASEVVMRALSTRLAPGQEEDWGLAGLLHDADVEIAPPERQGRLVGEWLGDSIPGAVTHAMAAHNPETGARPETPMDWALFAGEKLTGLIVASALIHKERKLKAIDVQFVLDRYKEKRFARGADRTQIARCDRLGLQLDEFVELALGAMQGISTELGL